MEPQETRLPSRDDMLTAVLTRDTSCDGLFFAAVTTTGVFCRPSCPARKPNPQNVEFYASAREALLAGFRPCLRCRPLEQGGRTPDWARELIAMVERRPESRVRDADIRAQGLDPVTVRRYFKESYGMTFQAYARARRLGEAFAAIANGGSIDEAVFRHGWESHSGFREAFAKATGMPPGKVAPASRDRQPGEATAPDADYVRLSWIATPLGTMLAGATSETICFLEFTDRKAIEAQLAALGHHIQRPLLPATSPLLDRLRCQLGEYFDGTRHGFDLPLDYPGSRFQCQVWDALRDIPYGETRSYAELARYLGKPGGARAVGRANGQNRLAILIPCHRVIAADGSLGGYGGGLWRKLRLLEAEKAVKRP